MIFQMATFITNIGFGARLEVDAVIMQDKYELLCNTVGKIIELNC